MVPDELPLPDGISKTHKTLSVVDLQQTIAENIATLVWYTPTNELLIHFINEFWDHDQLTCLADRELSDEGKQKLIAKIMDWETAFTDSVYRAAVILANREKKNHPERKWINMENIVLLAQELIQKENEDQKPPFQGLGYQ